MKRAVFLIFLLLTVSISAFALSACTECKHDNPITVRIADMTCEQDGAILHLCEDCGDTWMIYEPKTHDIETTLVSATCKEGEHTIYKCRKCPYLLKEFHGEQATCKFAEMRVEPTCLLGGYSYEFCVWCETQKNHTVLQKTDHLFVVSDDFITCYYCNTEDRSGCAHNFTSQEPTAPTCLSIGYTSCVCSRCSINAVKDVTDKKPCIFSLTYESAHSCSSFGKKVFKCDTCNYSFTELVCPSLHDGNETCLTCNQTVLLISESGRFTLSNGAVFTIVMSENNGFRLAIFCEEDGAIFFNPSTGKLIPLGVVFDGEKFLYELTPDSKEVVVCINLENQAEIEVEIEFFS